MRKALLAARGRRPQPERDDKVVAGWNALAVTALVEASAALGRSEWLAAARRAVALLLRVHVVDGRLRRTSRDGEVGDAPAVLEDHAALVEALLALHQATGRGAVAGRGPRRCSRPRSSTSPRSARTARTPAASGTPPTTPRRS